MALSEAIPASACRYMQLTELRNGNTLRQWSFSLTLAAALLTTLLLILQERNLQRLRRNERRILRERHRFEAVFFHSPLPILITEFPSTRIIEVNAAFQRRYGVDTATAAGKTTEELNLWQHTEVLQQHYRRLRKDQIVQTEDQHVINGSLEWLIITACRMTLDDRGCVINQFEIITPYKAAIQKLDSVLDSDQRHCAEVISRSANSLLELLNDILDLSRIEAGRMPVEPVIFSVADLAEDLSSLFGNQAVQKDLKFTVSIDRRPPLPPQRRCPAYSSDFVQPDRQRHKIHRPRRHRSAHLPRPQRR